MGNEKQKSTRQRRGSKITKEESQGSNLFEGTRQARKLRDRASELIYLPFRTTQLAKEQSVI